MLSFFDSLSIVYVLRNEPVCSALIQPQSVKELHLYLDALKVKQNKK